MKVLIWLLSAFLYGISITTLNFLDLTLGGIPAIALGAGALFLAKYLCRKWDERKSSNRAVKKESPATEASVAPLQSESNSTPKVHLFSELLDKPNIESLKHNLNPKTYKTPFLFLSVLSFILLVTVIVFGIMLLKFNNQIVRLETQVANLQNECANGYDDGYLDGYTYGLTDGLYYPDTVSDYTEAFLRNRREQLDEEKNDRTPKMPS